MKFWGEENLTKILGIGFLLDVCKEQNNRYNNIPFVLDKENMRRMF